MIFGTTQNHDNSKKKLLIFSFLFLPCSVSALTVSQLLTDTRVLIKDTQTTRQRYTDTQLIAFFNESQRDIVNNTWCVQKSTTINLSVSLSSYTLPSDFIYFFKVNYYQINGSTQITWTNLPETTVQSLDSQFQNTSWLLIATPPPIQYYFFDPAYSNFVWIYPQISTYTTTNPLGSLDIRYLAFPSDLALTTDVPFNSVTRLTPYHDLLVFWAAYRVFFLEGEAFKAQTYRQEYESRLELMMRDVGQKPNYNPGFSGPSNSR